MLQRTRRCGASVSTSKVQVTEPVLAVSVVATGIIALMQSALPLDLVRGGLARPSLSETWSGALIAWQLGLLVLLCGGAASAVVLWVRANADDIKAGAKEVQAEAHAFGLGSDQAACLDEGLRRAAPCMDMNIKCQVKAKLFTNFCLDVAPDTPDFCEGVPAKNELIAFTKWATQECSARGMLGNQGCQQLLQEQADHCAEREAAVPTP